MIKDIFNVIMRIVLMSSLVIRVYSASVCCMESK